MACTIRGTRSHKDSLLVLFDGISDRTGAEKLRKKWVRVSMTDRPELPQGEYYHHELIGLVVVSDEGQTLGIVSEILSTGSNDVLVVVAASGKELLIPTTDEVLVDIDPHSREISVKLIPGLLGE